MEGPSPGGLLTTGPTSLPEGLRAPDVPPGGAPGKSRLRAPGSVTGSVAVMETQERPVEETGLGRPQPTWGADPARLHSARGPSQGGLSGPTCGRAGHRVLGWAWGCRAEGGCQAPCPGWQLILTPYPGSWNWGSRLPGCERLQSRAQPPTAAGEEPGLARRQASGFPRTGQEWGSAGQSPWHPS